MILLLLFLEKTLGLTLMLTSNMTESIRDFKNFMVIAINHPKNSDILVAYLEAFGKKKQKTSGTYILTLNF